MNCLTIGIFVFLNVGLSMAANAQLSYDITPKEPVSLNGLEYGYSVRSEGKKDIANKGGTFNRYEITVYVTNKSGNTKMLLPRHTKIGFKNQDVLANFDCLNATGARLTSKSVAVRARPISAPVSVASAESKPVPTGSGPGSYMIENGETIKDNVIVIVPDEEEPRLRIRIHKTNLSSRSE